MTAPKTPQDISAIWAVEVLQISLDEARAHKESLGDVDCPALNNWISDAERRLASLLGGAYIKLPSIDDMTKLPGER